MIRSVARRKSAERGEMSAKISLHSTAIPEPSSASSRLPAPVHRGCLPVSVTARSNVLVAHAQRLLPVSFGGTLTSCMAMRVGLPMYGNSLPQ
jgi:hypothetical protein